MQFPRTNETKAHIVRTLLFAPQTPRYIFVWDFETAPIQIRVN